MTNDDLPNYRSALTDALGNVIDRGADLRVWLDDDLVDRRAPEGWVHLRTAREVCMMLLTGRVIEISLDCDLNGDIEFGKGEEVVDFLEELWVSDNRYLWPPDGITIHSANSASRKRMTQAMESLTRRFRIEVDSTITSGGKPHFEFNATARGKK